MNRTARNASLAALFVLLTLAGCNGSPCADAVVLIQYQHAGVTHTGCATAERDPPFFVSFTRHSDGGCELRQSAATGFGSTESGHAFLPGIVADHANMFATAGAVGVRVTIDDYLTNGCSASSCCPSGTCSWASAPAACTLVIDTPGGNGSNVTAHLAQPCTLQPFGFGDVGVDPVVVQSITLRGRLGFATDNGMLGAPMPAVEACP